MINKPFYPAYSVLSVLISTALISHAHANAPAHNTPANTQAFLVQPLHGEQVIDTTTIKPAQDTINPVLDDIRQAHQPDNPTTITADNASTVAALQQLDRQPDQASNQTASKLTTQTKPATNPEQQAQHEQVLSTLINQSYAQKDWTQLRASLVEYEQLAGHNRTLLGFAKAMLYRLDGKHDKAHDLYASILHEHSDYTFVRLAYAQSLYENKQYKQAQTQFLQIDKSLLLPPTAAMVDNYLTRISEAQKISPNIMFNYESNGNINNAGDSQVLSLYGNTYQKSASSLPIKDHGIRYRLGINKDSNITGNHYLTTGLQTDGIYYLNHPEYSEQSLEANIGYSYRNARTSAHITPSIDHTRFDNKPYYDKYGIQTGLRYMLRPNLQGRAEYGLSYTNYRNHNDYDSVRHHPQVSLMYFKNNYYLFGSLYHINDIANQDENSSKRYGISLGGEYTAPSGLGVQTNYSIAQRSFGAKHGLAGKVRQDIEQNLQIGLFHTKLQYKTIRPMLTWGISDVDSNIDELYSRRSNKVFVSLRSSF